MYIIGGEILWSKIRKLQRVKSINDNSQKRRYNMENFFYNIPTKVSFGKGAIDDLPGTSANMEIVFCWCTEAEV